MAFTKTPITSTYQTKTIRLMKELDSRSSSTSKDLDFLNVYFEPVKSKLTGENDYNIVKRQGTEAASATFTFTNARGLFYWEAEDVIFFAVDDLIQVINATNNTTVTTIDPGFSTTSGPVGFCEFLYSNGDVVIVATDGTTMVGIQDNWTHATVTDPDLPTPHVPTPVFLDGYLFIAKADTADIYNSNLDTIGDWDPSNFITAEMFGDTVVHLSKLNNYLLAFGNNSIEYFWDAANETGSPLQRNDSPVKLNGFLGGAAHYGNRLYFIGNTADTTPTLYVLEDFKLKELGDETVRKYLESLTGTLYTIYGNVVSFGGHDFYVLYVGTGSTFVLDLKNDLWSRWAYQGTDTFKLKYATAVKRNTASITIGHLENRADLFRFNPTVYQDFGTNYTVRLVTDREMFDTYNQKTMNRLTVNSDKPTSSASISLSWSDDDYQTYNTPVTIDLYQELPCTYRLGRFRRRAFKLEFTQNQPLRIKNLEVDINMGQS